MEFWRYYRIIRRRRWLILLGMIICVGTVAYSSFNAPSALIGRTTLQEQRGVSSEGVPLYPEQYTQTDIQLQLSNFANTAMSRRVREKVAMRVMELGEVSISREDIRRLLFTSVDARPEKDTNIIAIEVTLPATQRGGESRLDAERRTAQDAQHIAEVYAEVFKEDYAELNSNKEALNKSLQFIQNQVEETRKRMVDAQNELRDFKEKNNIVEIERQTSAVVQRLEQAKTSLAQAEANRRAYAAQVSKAASEVEGIPDWEKVSETTAVNPVWQRLSQQLVELESAKAGMLGNRDLGKAGRSVNHPDVIAIQAQIDSVKEELASTAQSEYIKSSTTESKSTLHTNSVDRLIDSRVREVAAEAQVQVYQNEVAEARAEMSRLPGQAADYAALQTNVQAATETYGLMRSKLDEARIKEQREPVLVKMIDRPYVTLAPDRSVLKLALALLLSPLLGVGVAFMLYYMDNTIKTPADAEKLLGLPVLSAVPNVKAHSFARHKGHPDYLDIAYQMLTSSIWVADRNHGVKSIALVSAEPDMGRSIVASNLAIALANEGARVVLVDADFRQGTQARLFNVDNKVGLTNVISGAASLEDALVPTRSQGVLLLPTGPVPDNSVGLLRSEAFKGVDQELRELADFVIYDTPSGVSFPDPVLVAAHVGTALVVHSAGRVPRGSEADLSARLESVGVSILGVVLNKVRKEDSSGYFHYRRSYQGLDAVSSKAASGKGK